MLNQIEEYLKNNKLLECISYLREKTKCFSLIKLLCEKVVNDDTIQKNPSFWNDYSIAYYYLGNKEKAYQIYDNIFPYEKTVFNSESEANFYLNNMSFSSPQIIQNNIFVSMDSLLNNKHEYICLNHNLSDKLIQNYHPMNPSIVKIEDGYLINIRTVNYLFDPNFRYITNGPCNSINYLINLDQNLNIININELKYQNMPYNGNFDGWEDIRLFYYRDKLHCSFTTLQVTENRRQTICISNLSDDIPSHISLNNYGSDKIQKNWVPLISKNKDLFFIYSFNPLTILKYDEEIKNAKLHQISKVNKMNKWRGGSPALQLEELGYENYYLCVIHESEFPKYKHKFILLEEIKENIFQIKSESDFFYFIDGIVEFTSGLCISHDKKDFILSFGKMDQKSYITKINIKDIFCQFNIQ